MLYMNRGCVKIGTSSFSVYQSAVRVYLTILVTVFHFLIIYSARQAIKELYCSLYSVKKSLKRVFMLPFSLLQSFS